LETSVVDPKYHHGTPSDFTTLEIARSNPHGPVIFAAILYPVRRMAGGCPSPAADRRRQRDQRPAHHRRALPGRHPVQARPRARPGAVRAPLSLAPVPERWPRRLRDELGSELALGRGEDRAAGPAGGGGARHRADDAGHWLLRPAGLGPAHRPRDEARLRRRADAAAVLLQGCERRRALSELRGGDRARG